jgi:hypothetical protein
MGWGCCGTTKVTPCYKYVAWFAFTIGDAQMFDRIASAIHDRQLGRWEKKRARGKQSFVWYRGALRWGGIMFVLTTITNVLVRHRELDWMLVVSALIACPLAGYLWARCIWFVNEHRFGYKAKQ